MPDIGKTLKSEIARIAKREANGLLKLFFGTISSRNWRNITARLPGQYLQS